MPYTTDERLKSYLDTNQLAREQLCRSILSLDNRFSEVNPRHPRGGPDGARDIEGVYQNKYRTFGAIGFMNQANDSREQQRTIKAKFLSDLNSAIGAEKTPEVFIFFTNINMTIAEKSELYKEATNNGIVHSEILDRERLRIALDSPDGFSIRYQYLGIPLSESEQASFFAKWGDDIQSIISSGFQRVEKSITRMIFLQESMNTIENIFVVFTFFRKYTSEEIGHFRIILDLSLVEQKYNIHSLLIGISDKADRYRVEQIENIDALPINAKYGFSGGQWEQMEKGEELKYEVRSTFSSIGVDSFDKLHIEYSTGSLIRFGPCLTLHDLDKSSFLPIISQNLVDKISKIDIYCNQYHIKTIESENITYDNTNGEMEIPMKFTDKELEIPWMRVFDKKGMCFRMNFDEITPKRIIEY